MTLLLGSDIGCAGKAHSRGLEGRGQPVGFIAIDASSSGRSHHRQLASRSQSHLLQQIGPGFISQHRIAFGGLIHLDHQELGDSAVVTRSSFAAALISGHTSGLLASVPLANFVVFRNYVGITERMQEPA
jgi:hypothetical protein